MSDSQSEHDFIKLPLKIMLLTVKAMYNFLVSNGIQHWFLTWWHCPVAKFFFKSQDGGMANSVYQPFCPLKHLIHIKEHAVLLLYLLCLCHKFYVEHSVVLMFFFISCLQHFCLFFLQLSNLQTNFTQPLPVCLHGDKDWFSGTEWSKCVLLLH